MTKSPERWLIIEGDLTGHHEVYLTELGRGALETNRQLTIVTSDNVKNAEALARIQKVLPAALFIKLPLPSGCHAFGGTMADLKREFSFWLFMQNAYKTANKYYSHSNVFLPYFDYITYITAILGSPFKKTKFSGVVMRPTFHYEKMGVEIPHRKSETVKKYLFEQLLKCSTLTYLYTIDETLAAFAKEQKPLAWEKIKLMHDPAYLDGDLSRSEARNELGLNQDLRILLLYGAVDLRKGIKQLIAAIASMELPVNFMLVVAGQCNTDASSVLTGDVAQQLKNKNTLMVIDRRITDEEEQILLSAADAIWVGYDGHYTMSGVVVKAAMANRPILACKSGLIGWHGKRRSGSYIIDINSKEQISHAILAILPSSEKFIHGLLPQHTWKTAVNLILN